MKIFKCEFLGLFTEYGMHDIRGHVRMHQDHDKFGGRSGELTVTSQIKFIDFERGIFMTRNNIYDFSK